MSWVAFGDLEVCPFRPTDSEEFKSAQRLFEPICGMAESAANRARRPQRPWLTGPLASAKTPATMRLVPTSSTRSCVTA
jgi:hypothetical protein